MRGCLALLPSMLLFALVSCDAEPPPPEPGAATPPAGVLAATQEEFWTNLQALCGRAFRGGETEAIDFDTDFADEGMIVHFRECATTEARIPLHVGENRSRTWIVTRTSEGLRLKHDHRHEDGTEEEITQYGGDTAEPGTATVQAFPMDEYTTELLPGAPYHVWSMELVPGDRFAYMLDLPEDGRRVRFEFDLEDEVEPPPPPWGYEDR